MRFTIVVISLSSVFPNVSGAQTIAQKFSTEINADRLKDNLSIIASDALEGRETGSRGQKMAAAFISHHFESIGLRGPLNGSYFQEFNLYTSQQGRASVKISNKEFLNLEDVVFHESWNGSQTLDVVYVGDGKRDLPNGSLNGKAALVHWQGFSLFSSQNVIAKLKKAGASMVMLYPQATPEEFRRFATQVKEQQDEPEYTMEKPLIEVNNFGVVFVNTKVVESIAGSEHEMKRLLESRPGRKLGTATLTSEVMVKTMTTENVLGFLEGTDKKEEVIVITAHYDHVGTRSTGDDRIYNGADDDGSGTVTVLQIAQAFAEARKQGFAPRRSILFMTVSAEEWGLFGSEYYVNHPVFPLANTVANLNIDMIGRRDPEHKDSPDYVYVIGADKLSSELHELNERNNNAYTQLKFDYTFNDEHHPTNLYQRSDHWNFAKNRVPIIFYFDGIHEDYHEVTDEVDRIDFELLTKRARAVFYVAWDLATQDERIKVDK